MDRQKTIQNQAQYVEKQVWHPYMLQQLNTSNFVSISNRILSGEFGLLTLRTRRKSGHS